jgi:ribosomal protein S18 acetylase RimI-like enzyme
MNTLQQGPVPGDESLAQLLMTAWEEARQLPRAVPTPSEIPALTPKEVQAHRAEGWLNPALTVVSGGHQPVLVAEVRLMEDETAQFGWTGTHPAVRRQGLARQAVELLLAELRAREVKSVRTMMVDSRLTGLCAFWEAMGFVVPDPHRQSIVMRVDLIAHPPPPMPTLPAPYTLHPLTPADIPGWLTVKNQAFESASELAWLENTFLHRWDFDWDGWMSLKLHDEIVGIAAADYRRDPQRPSVVTGAHIEYVGLRPDCRGLGLGEAIMLACLHHIVNRGQTSCTLVTQPFRVPAVRLYEKLGFRLVRENRYYSRELTP